MHNGVMVGRASARAGRFGALLLGCGLVACGGQRSSGSVAEVDVADSDSSAQDAAGSADAAADTTLADSEGSADVAEDSTNLDSNGSADAAIEDITPDSAPEDAAPDTAVEDADGDTTPPPFPLCPRFNAGVSAGYVSNLNIREASGLAASHRYGNLLWVHNDSGDTNRVFAIATNGASFATYVLGGAEANDWEDIAVGPGPDPAQSYVYVGDIGDNGGNRNSIEVYRFPEPEVTNSPFNITLTNVDRLEFRYPDSRGENAETLMVDPTNGDIYVVSKSGTGEARVYRASPPFVPLDRVTMTLVASLQFGTAPLIGDPSTTAGDFSPSGEFLAIRTYNTAYVWRRPAGSTVEEAFATSPCPIPIASESQGEAFGFNRDGTGYFTMGEGSLVQLNSYSAR